MRPSWEASGRLVCASFLSGSRGVRRARPVGRFRDLDVKLTMSTPPATCAPQRASEIVGTRVLKAAGDVMVRTVKFPCFRRRHGVRGGPAAGSHSAGPMGSTVMLPPKHSTTGVAKTPPRGMTCSSCLAFVQ